MVSLLETMWLIRAFEEKVAELYARGEISGLLHLGIGQEAVAAGAASALNNDDYVFAGHRPHAHALAKGADPKLVLAELAGRASGYCGGKGGSMHLVANDVGFVTATGVVGGNIPLSLGAAYGCKMFGESQVAVAFFGDGAGQTGVFHESLNIAALWHLPVVFVCENNGYAEFTPLSAHTVVERLADHAETYRIPCVTVDGNDVVITGNALSEAVAKVRSESGPYFVECLTYRLRGHYEGDQAKYRQLSELENWKTRDPIQRFETMLRDNLRVAEKRLRRIETKARKSVDEASGWALQQPWPETSELASGVYAG